MSRRRVAIAPGAAVLTFTLASVACAVQSDVPSAFDESAGRVDVTLCGDGFVREGGRRVPLETIVLELRQRLRAMPREDIGRFVVDLAGDGDAIARGGAAGVMHDRDRLMRELELMGVKQVRFR